jgi:hypothetical protein
MPGNDAAELAKIGQVGEETRLENDSNALLSTTKQKITRQAKGEKSGT